MKRAFREFRVLVSTTTNTGQNLARERFGEANVFYFPLDFSFAIRSYLGMFKPTLVILAETEFWPNFLRLAHAGGARIAVVNARISNRSLTGYSRWRWLFPGLLQQIDLLLAQSEEDRRRLVALGACASRTQIAGNLKYDAPLPAAKPIVTSLRTALRQAGAGPVIVCGSTLDGEEPLLLRAFENVRASYPRAVMILAPRHPERFSEVAQLLEKIGTRFWRRSLWSGDPIEGGVFLLDSIGELASVYAVGDVAFVGGSLVPRGGHNILEPAQHGVPIIVGNHTENFRDMVELFQSRDAIRVVGPAELPLVLMELVSSEAERHALGWRAAETIRAQMGATERTVQALRSLLKADQDRVSPVV
jgi:3-deoxy-D-manno-octulosonic-acid transferase